MNKKTILILGDVLAIAILTIIGFATHGETELSFLPRMAAVFFPTLIAWFMLAPWFGLFDEKILGEWKNLYRILLAAIFAGPFALVLRAFVLNAPIIPIFAAVFASSSALGMAVWRAIYKLTVSGKR